MHIEFEKSRRIFMVSNTIYDSRVLTASEILHLNLHKHTYNGGMKFTWDEKKRRANILNHGFDFIDAKEVFEGITITIEDDRFDYGEERFITLGLLKGTILVIAHTEKGDEIRLISMRKGTKHEQKIYFEGLSD